MTFKQFLIQWACLTALMIGVWSIQYIPNHYCQAAFGMPCYAHQGEAK
jgi:hypothetical protein